MTDRDQKPPKSTRTHSHGSDTTTDTPPAPSSSSSPQNRRTEMLEQAAGLLHKLSADERADLRVRLDRLFREMKGIVELARKHMTRDEFTQAYAELEDAEQEIRNAIP